MTQSAKPETQKSLSGRFSRAFVPCALLLFLAVNSIKVTAFGYVLSASPNSFLTYLGSAIPQAAALTCLVYLIAFRQSSPLSFVIFYILQVLFLLANLIYFFFFESYLHLNQYFELWAETWELVKRSAVPFEPGTLIAVLDLPLFFFLVFRYRRIKALNGRALFRYALYAPCLFLIVSLARWDTFKTPTPLELMNDRYLSESQVVKKYGILVFDVMSLVRMGNNRRLIALLNRGDVLSKEADSTVPSPNFLCIQVESMDAFVVKEHYQGKPITPFLNSLSKKSVYYPFTLSYHKAGSTSDCEFSCVNSTEALDASPSMKIRNYDFPNSLIKRLSAMGYDIAFFHGNRGEYFNRKSAFRKMGVPAFYDIKAMNLKEVAWGAPDHEVLRFMMGKIDEMKEPFFSYVITMSSHEPFTFTRHYYSTTRFRSIKDDRVRNFFTCMAYVDEQLRVVCSEIQKRYPNTYIFIYGDHAPGVKRGPYRQAAFKEGDLYYEYVPLFIITPNRRVHHEKRLAACFLDIAPTVLTASGGAFTIRTFGEDLLQDSLPASSTIPFRGERHCRKELFSKIARLKSK